MRRRGEREHEKELCECEQLSPQNSCSHRPHTKWQGAVLCDEGRTTTRLRLSATFEKKFFLLLIPHAHIHILPGGVATSAAVPDSKTTKLCAPLYQLYECHVCPPVSTFTEIFTECMSTHLLVIFPCFLSLHECRILTCVIEYLVEQKFKWFSQHYYLSNFQRNFRIPNWNYSRIMFNMNLWSK